MARQDARDAEVSRCAGASRLILSSHARRFMIADKPPLPLPPRRDIYCAGVIGGGQFRFVAGQVSRRIYLEESRVTAQGAAHHAGRRAQQHF